MKPTTLYLLLSLFTFLVLVAALAAQDAAAAGSSQANVITIDAVPDGAVGTFHYVAVDCPHEPRYIYAADTDRHVIRRKELLTGTWEVLAGEVDKPGAKDGPHGTALFNQPTSICVNPAGVLIVADLGNACLRLVSPTGLVSTLAGHCGSTGTRDGPGSSALFSDTIKSIACLSNCSVLVGDVANGRIRSVIVDDPTCAAAADKAEAHKFAAGTLVLTAIACVLGTMLLAAAAAAVLLKTNPGAAEAFTQGYRRLWGGDEGGEAS